LALHFGRVDIIRDMTIVFGNQIQWGCIPPVSHADQGKKANAMSTTLSTRITVPPLSSHRCGWLERLLLTPTIGHDNGRRVAAVIALILPHHYRQHLLLMCPHPRAFGTNKKCHDDIKEKNDTKTSTASSSNPGTMSNVNRSSEKNEQSENGLTLLASLFHLQIPGAITHKHFPIRQQPRIRRSYRSGTYHTLNRLACVIVPSLAHDAMLTFLMGTIPTRRTTSGKDGHNHANGINISNENGKLEKSSIHSHFANHYLYDRQLIGMIFDALCQQYQSWLVGEWATRNHHYRDNGTRYKQPSVKYPLGWPSI
jgi:hypothetical protein